MTEMVEILSHLQTSDYFRKHFLALSQEEKDSFNKNLLSFDLPLLKACQNSIFSPPNPFKTVFPLRKVDFYGEEDWAFAGESIIQKKEVGLVLLAGGMGSRLGWAGPKGTFRISPSKKKALFEIICGKIGAASEKYGVTFPLAILTSEKNHFETVRFFEENSWCGLEKNSITFHRQGNTPFLDPNGWPILETRTKLADGPDGNGSVFQTLLRDRIFDDFERKGIKYLMVLLVDNPLADPIDPYLVGFHVGKGADLSLRTFKRESKEEKVGLIVETSEGIRVVEYTEFPEEMGLRQDQFEWANTSLCLMDLSLAVEAATETPSIPFHKQWKSFQSSFGERNGWKFERYLFDYFPLAKKICPLAYPREVLFSPLKNRTGLNSPDTLRKALTRRDRCVLSEITGQQVPSEVEEIDLRFYYPSADLKEKWKGRRPPKKSYVEADF